MNLRDRLKSFFQGMGSVLEIMPESVGLKSKYEYQSDSEALASDWKKVGGDLYRAVNQYEKTRQGL